MKNKIYSNKKSMKFKLFVSYLFLFTMPAILMGVISFGWFSNIVKENSKKSYENVLSKTVKTMDDQVKEIQNIAIQLSQTYWVKKLMYMQGDSIDYSRVDIMNMEDYITQLQVSNTSKRFLDDITIFFNGKNYVISSLGQYDLKLFNDIYYMEGKSKDEYLNIVDEYNNANIIPNIDMNISRRKKHGMLYLQSLPLYASNGMKATFMGFINQSTFEDSVDILRIDKEAGICIVDKYGRYLMSKNIDNNIIKSIKNNTTDKNEFHQISCKNKKYFVFTNNSSINGWTYYISIPKETVMKDVNKINLIITLIMLISFVIGIFMSLKFAAINYRPIDELIKQIKVKLNLKDDRMNYNEFDWLSQNLSDIFKQEESFRTKLEEQKPLLRHVYLMKLINDDFEYNMEFNKALELLGINFPYTYFTCLNILYKCNEIEMFLDEIIDIASEHDIYTYKLKISTNGYELICNCNDINLYNKFMVNLENVLTKDKSIFIGAGSFYEGIHGVAKSYRDAIKASEYRKLNDSNKIVLCDEIKNKTCFYYFSIEEENLMRNYLLSGDYENVVKVFEKAYEINLNNNNLSVDAIKMFLYNIQRIVLKVIKERGLKDEIGINLEESYNFETIDDMKTAIMQVCKKICDIINEKKKLCNVKIEKIILDYIEENYINSSFSLSMAADKIDVSSSYLSKFFKEQVGCNFLEYLNKKRIELSKQKLISESTDINTIARDVGYDNDVTFRRIFKKYEGISPSEYRKLNSLKSL